MLQLFLRDVYYLLDLGSTLLYVTPFVIVCIGFDPELISDPFSISTPIGDSVITKIAYRRVWNMFVVGRLWWIYLNLIW